MLVPVNKLERRIPEKHLPCRMLRKSRYKSLGVIYRAAFSLQISCDFSNPRGLWIPREIKSILFTTLLSVYTIYEEIHYIIPQKFTAYLKLSTITM
jgi:hypothetical protein